jgi:chromosome partitioning protein
MITITVANQKGGVAKTTTAANVAVVLAQDGHRVLAVDADPQCHLTWQLGARPGAFTLRDVLDPDVDRPAADAVVAAPLEGVSVLPGSEGLAGLEIALALAVAGQVRLRQALAELADRFDVAVIDCPPNLGPLVINALVAADAVLVPVSAEDVGAAQGLARLRDSNGRTGPLRGRDPAPLLPVLTRWDDRRQVAGRMSATLEQLGAEPVARIPLRAAVQQAAVARVPLAARRPDSLIASEYRKAAAAAMGHVARV